MNFPSEKACVSPNCKWEVRCRSTQQGDGGWLHRLFLGPLGATEPVFIYASGRNCDVLWSKDSRRIALTDWSGSNLSEIYIVDVPTHTVQLLEIPGLSHPLSKEELDGHIYWEAMQWDAADRLQIRVFGHTDEAQGHAFTYFFSVNIISKEITLLRQASEEAAD